MTRWLHCDADCPRRPWFNLREGRTYRCRCGRVWRLRSRLNRRWELVSPPQDQPPEDSEK